MAVSASTRSGLRPDGWSTTRAVLTVLVAVAVTSAGAAQASGPPSEVAARSAMAALLAYGTAAGWIVATAWHRNGPGWVWGNPARARTVLLTAAAGVGMVAGTLLAYAVVGHLWTLPPPSDTLAAALASTPGGAAAYVAAAILAGPLAEELVWRRYLLDWAAARVPAWCALTVISVLFGAVHASAGWPYATAAALHGVVYGLLWLRHRSLAVVVATHATYNTLVLTADLLSS